MGGSALLQQQLLASAATNATDGLLAPIGVQNLMTLAAMNQPTVTATNPLCIVKDRSGGVPCLGGGGQVGAPQLVGPQGASLTDLTGAYAGTLLGSAGLSTAAAAAAGKQVEGKEN